MKKFAYTGALITVVKMLRKCLPEHIWKDKMCKADRKSLTLEKKAIQYNVLSKLTTVCVKPSNNNKNVIQE